MIHRYKLGGMNIVLDICSGSVHLVDEVAYDMIGLFETESREAITAAIARHRHADTVLFSFGGIGSTPDDHTRQCAAAAHQQPLAIHPEGKIIVEGRFGAEAYPHRINMVNIPAHATLIPNPVNQMPGFSVGQHHFVPGFPSMAWPMIEWVLERVIK